MICSQLIPGAIFSILNNQRAPAKEAPVVKKFLSLIINIFAHFVNGFLSQTVLYTINTSINVALKFDKMIQNENRNMPVIEESLVDTVEDSLIGSSFTEKVIERTMNTEKPLGLGTIFELLNYFNLIHANQEVLEIISDPLVLHFMNVNIADRYMQIWNSVFDLLNRQFKNYNSQRLLAAWNKILIHMAEVFLSSQSFEYRLYAPLFISSISYDESIAKWIKEDKVIMRILKDTSVHTEIVKRSEMIVKNVVKAGQIDEETVNHLMPFFSSDAPKDIRGMMLNIIKGATEEMPDDIPSIFDKAFANLPEEEFFEYDISEVVICIIKACILSKGSKSCCLCMRRLLKSAMDDDTDDQNSVSGLCNEMIVEGKQESTVEDKMNDENRQCNSVNKLINMFLSFNTNTTESADTIPTSSVIVPYFKEFIENIRNHKNSWQSCYIASNINDFLKFLDPLDFIDLIIKDMEHFKQKIAVQYMDEIKRCGPNNFVIPWTLTTYKKQMEYRLNALEKAIPSHVNASSIRLYDLWDIYVRAPIHSTDQEMLMVFLFNLFKNNSILIDEEIISRLLFEKIPMLDFSSLTDNGVHFILDLIKSINLFKKKCIFIAETNNCVIPNYNEYIGLDLLWKIVLEVDNDDVALIGTNFLSMLSKHTQTSSYKADIVAVALKKLEEANTSKYGRLLNLIKNILTKIPSQNTQQGTCEVSIADESYNAFYRVLMSNAPQSAKEVCIHILLHDIPFDKHLEEKVRTLLGEKSEGEVVNNNWSKVFGPEKGSFFTKYALLVLNHIKPTEDALLESGLAGYLALQSFQVPTDKDDREHFDLCATLVELFSAHSATVMQALNSEEARRAYIKKIIDLIYFCLHTLSSESVSDCLRNCIELIKNIYPAIDDSSMDVELCDLEQNKDASFIFADGCIDEKWLHVALIECHNRDDTQKLFSHLFQYINDANTKIKVLNYFLSLASNPELNENNFFLVLVKFIKDQNFDYPTLEGILSNVYKLLTTEQAQEDAIHNNVESRSLGLIFFAYKVSDELLKHADEKVQEEWESTERDVVNTILHVYLFGEPIPKCQSPSSRQFGLDTIYRFISLWTKRNKELYAQYIKDILETINKQAEYIGLSEDTHYITQTQIKTRFLRYAGIKNLGSTCYMNSILQQLYMIPAFRDGILRLDLTNHKKKFLWELQKMFSKMQDGCKAYVSTKELIKTFEINGNHINPREQMDAMELFETLIDKISSEAKNISGDDFVQEIFGYKTCSQLIPKTCPHSKESSVPCTSITVDVSGMTGLQNSLSCWVKGDMLVGENKYMCEKCNEKRDTLKRTCFLTSPNVLVIQCKRFAFNYDSWRLTKINSYFEFPMYFSIYPYTKEGIERSNAPHSEEEYEYDLVGIVMHNGDAGFGHYYSYIKDRDGSDNWINFNDTMLDYFNPNDIKRNCYGGYGEELHSAYILFYQKRSYTGVATVPHQQHFNVSPSRNEFLTKINNNNKKLMKSFTLFDDSFAEFIRKLFLTDNAPLLPVINPSMIASYFLYVLPYLNNSDSRSPDKVNLWKRALENACRSNPEFLNVLFSNGNKTLQYGLTQIPDENIRKAFASVISTKISTLKGAAQENAVLTCISLLKDATADWVSFSELFCVYKAIIPDVPKAASILLNEHVIATSINLMLPKNDPSSSNIIVLNGNIISSAYHLVDAIKSIIYVNPNDFDSIPDLDKNMLFQEGFYYVLASREHKVAADMLEFLLERVRGDDNVRRLMKCLGTVVETIKSDKVDEFFTIIYEFFKNKDLFTPVHADSFMKEIISIEKNWIKKKENFHTLNILSTKFVDPARCPAITEWLLTNLHMWFELFIISPIYYLNREGALAMLFRAAGCDLLDLPNEKLLDVDKAQKLRRILSFVLDNFAEFTKDKITVSVKYYPLSLALVTCMRPEVHGAELVSKEHVNTLLEFVSKLNELQLTRKETLWNKNPKYYIAEFLVSAAGLPGGETISVNMTYSVHFRNFVTFVKGKDTVNKDYVKDAEEAIKTMCHAIRLILVRSPSALEPFFPSSETFEWLLKRILFAKSEIDAPFARKAVAELMRDMLMAETAGLNIAVAKRLGSVFVSLDGTSLDDAISFFEEVVFSPPSSLQKELLPNSSIAAFCGSGGILRFLRESLQSEDERRSKVNAFASTLFSVISTRDDRAKCLQERGGNIDQCKIDFTNLAVDVFFLNRHDTNNDVWLLLPQLIPDRRFFINDLWVKLVNELPQNCGEIAKRFVGTVIEEEAKRGDENSVYASLVLLYCAVFFDSLQYTEKVATIASSEIARRFVDDIFSSRAATCIEKPTEREVSTMKIIVANIQNRRELALSFVKVLNGASLVTDGDKRIWLRRLEILLTYFAEDVPKESLQDVENIMTRIDYEYCQIHNKISTLKKYF